MDNSSIAFSKIDLPVWRQKQKRPWELGSRPWPSSSIQSIIAARGKPPLCSPSTTNCPVSL